MGEHHGTCTKCGCYFSDGNHQFICNKCVEEEKIIMTIEYKCMVCGKEYSAGNIPTIGKADGCCTPGSLIEIKK